MTFWRITVKVRGVPAPVDRLYAAFGRRIRELRTGRELSQQTLAKRVGLTRTSITNVEGGRQHVSLGLIYRLAGALGEPPERLLPTTDAGFGQSEDPLDDQMAELSDIDQRFVRQLAEGPAARVVKGA